MEELKKKVFAEAEKWLENYSCNERKGDELLNNSEQFSAACIVNSAGELEEEIERHRPFGAKDGEFELDILNEMFEYFKSLNNKFDSLKECEECGRFFWEGECEACELKKEEEG